MCYSLSVSSSSFSPSSPLSSFAASCCSVKDSEQRRGSRCRYLSKPSIWKLRTVQLRLLTLSEISLVRAGLLPAPHVCVHKPLLKSIRTIACIGFCRVYRWTPARRFVSRWRRHSLWLQDQVMPLRASLPTARELLLSYTNIRRAAQVHLADPQ